MKKQVWDKPRPKGLGKSKALSPGQKASAKAAAKAAGRPYPNLFYAESCSAHVLLYHGF